jgi:hypothetical protein
MDNDRYWVSAVELARPAYDVIFGVLVEVALSERIGVEAVEELGDAFYTKLYGIVLIIGGHLDTSLLKAGSH